MDTSLIVACIGVVSVLASALVQYKLGRLNERSKKEEEVRTQAYLDFVNVYRSSYHLTPASNRCLVY
ncbi:hypothetical protein, partial [Aeromonas caviae]|uniref:hypothetical protein n=1 Tax=Aeromonas caviae TaxID=648 RepID=UPI002B4A9DA4